MSADQPVDQQLHPKADTEYVKGASKLGAALETAEKEAPPAAKGAIGWVRNTTLVIILIGALYMFLVALKLMGDSFKTVGACGMGTFFSAISNPIAGLTAGVIATVALQSSSTTTSIVVSLVGSGLLPIRPAIPVIMGANIGTSVTNTIVSLGQMNHLGEFKRAFAGATVHDCFNLCSVLILLPIEWIFNMLEHLTDAIMHDDIGTTGEKWESPFDTIVKVITKHIIVPDKDVITGVASGELDCSVTDPNSTKYVDHLLKEGLAWLPIHKGDAVVAGTAFQRAEFSYGVFMVFVSLAMLMIALTIMVKVMRYLLIGSVKKTFERVVHQNYIGHEYVAMLIGAGLTMLVQSSSITTSVLTPLVGLGTIDLEHMFPLTLGANVGTTITGLLAALVSDKPEGMQIALCHLFFNIFGILIWYSLIYVGACGHLGTRFRRCGRSLCGWPGASGRSQPSSAGSLSHTS
mmetsp:Transcript_4215/g.10943  ORF Transcript_4215/g.10943 Transcript_4215/m.10943 type:complete len:462 (-) Transcript_4215:3365-4750(-)